MMRRGSAGYSQGSRPPSRRQDPGYPPTRVKPEATCESRASGMLRIMSVAMMLTPRKRNGDVIQQTFTVK